MQGIFFTQELKELIVQIKDGKQQRTTLQHPQKRVREKVVLPDPKSHLWEMEPHSSGWLRSVC